MTRTRRLLILIGAVVIAGLLAFPLRGMIYETIVIPAAFIAWNLSLLYRSYPQGIWWLVVVFIVLVMLVFSLVPRSVSRGRVEEKRKPPQGQVESLAVNLHRAEQGVYFKWVVANRLGKLAYNILRHRENGKPRSVFAPLLGADWEPSKDLQNYLETGLHGSFADFPNVSRFSGAHQKTPLDINVVEAVEFLESHLENGNLPQRHGDTEI
jgi:hypothetical protein